MIRVFADKTELVTQITQEISRDLQEAIDQRGSANILLSGGSTPGPIYQKLNEKSELLSSLHVGLVDERFVPITSKKSNERLIRSCFDEGVRISGMVSNAQDEVQNLRDVSKRYQPFVEHTDVVVLGMGTDGHTASIFPYDPASDDIRRHKREGVFSTKAPNNPTNRITCGIGTLLKAKKIYLVIFGNEKLNILGGLRENLPIHDFLKNREDINIVYA